MGGSQRVAVYVDGFNLFYGIRDKGWRRYYWLDVHRLAENLMKPGQTLELVRYFTARVLPENDDPCKPMRQKVYLEALETTPNLSIHEGYFQSGKRKCADCGAVRKVYEEKMTDVNIAINLLNDAYEDAFDTAMIISADSDLVEPIEAIQKRFPKKRVVVAFPPRRSAVHLHNVATATFTIGRSVIKRSQFPDSIVGKDGLALTRPSRWI